MRRASTSCVCIPMLAEATAADAKNPHQIDTHTRAPLPPFVPHQFFLITFLTFVLVPWTFWTIKPAREPSASFGVKAEWLFSTFHVRVPACSHAHPHRVQRVKSQTSSRWLERQA